MGNIRLYGSTSGYTELAPPAVAPDGVLSLPSGVGTLLTAEGGKILQIVRATDTTSRSTTSTSYVDTTFNITITPQRSSSAIIIVVFAMLQIAGSTQSQSRLAITDNSNNVLAEIMTNTGGLNPATAQSTWAYSTPGTTSATTYKTRLKSGSGSITALSANDDITGQLYAIEVSA